MLHRIVRTSQRAALRQSLVRQHGHIYGFRSQPRPLLTSTRSLHDDSDALSSSHGTSYAPSRAPSYQTGSIDMIGEPQPDMTMTKAQLNGLKEFANTRMSDFQDMLDSSLARQTRALDFKLDSKIGRLDSKFDSEIKTLDSKFDAKIMTLDSEFDSKFDTRLELRYYQYLNLFLWRGFWTFIIVALSLEFGITIDRYFLR